MRIKTASPNMWQEPWPIGLRYIIPPPADSIKEKSLNTKAMITYKRRTTMGLQLTLYKNLALNKEKKTNPRLFGPYKHCVTATDNATNRRTQPFHISRQKTTFPLNQSLIWANYGICVLTYAICSQQYVCQTVNKFFRRWSAHRGTWNKSDNRGDTLSRHCTVFHGIQNKPPNYDSCTVKFVEQPSFDSLDTAKINGLTS